MNPVDESIGLGPLLNGCRTSDGIVCAWSAHARKEPGGDHVSALADRIVGTTLHDFDHPNAGGPTQRIDSFKQADIIRHLSNWLVGRIVEPIDFREPTENEEGRASFAAAIEFNAQRPGLYGAVLVLYGGYLDEEQELRWKILAGADDEGNPDTSSGAGSFAVVSGNSLGGEDEVLTVDVDIDPVNPSDPTTRITSVRPVIVPLGSDGLKVPLEPPDQSFTIAPPTL